MPTRKTIDTETEETPEPEKTEEVPPSEGAHACAICGQPATMVSASEYVSPAYYCSDHGKNEPLKPIGS